MPRYIRILRVALFSLLAGLLSALNAHAQSFPTKVVTLLVAYPAGSTADATARMIAPGLQAALGQPVVVDNLAGAGGSLGAQKVLSAPADGHTLLYGTPIELTQTPMALASVKYKSEDFRLVGPIASSYLMLVVRPSMEANTLAELVSLAKRAPAGRELTFGSFGRGSSNHLLAERLAQDTGIKLLHVPYKASPQMFTDITGGQIDMAFVSLGGPIPGLIQTGRFKAIGFTGPSRHSAFPNVPTMNETQLVKDFVFDLWGGLVVAKDTPEPVLRRLSAALAEVMKQPQVRSAIEASGLTAGSVMGLDEASRLYAADIARFRAIGNSIKLQPE